MKLSSLREASSDDDDTHFNMWEWCSENIFDFHALYKQGEIVLDIESKKIIAEEILLITSDTELPYTLAISETLDLKAPKLVSFTNFGFNTSPYIKFLLETKLDFNQLSTLDVPDNTKFSFKFMFHNTLNANMFTQNTFSHLYFHHCRSTTLYDFSQYRNNDIIEKFRVVGNIAPTNVTYLLDRNVYIGKVEFEDVITIDGELLAQIINKYLNYRDTENYVMDFTVEVLDSGFDESIL